MRVSFFVLSIANGMKASPALNVSIFSVRVEQMSAQAPPQAFRACVLTTPCSKVVRPSAARHRDVN